MNAIKSIGVFGGSATGDESAYVENAALFGKKLALRRITMNYGAGQTGVVGAAAKACLDAGGKVVGFINDYLNEREPFNFPLSDLKIYTQMHERKDALFNASDAFCVLPGGLGTLDEVVEVMVLKQINEHNKPIVFYNPNGFWNPLKSCVDSFIQTQFAKKTDAGLAVYADGIEQVFAGLGI